VVLEAEAPSVDGVHFCLDAKTNQKDQGCAGIGYLRSDSAKMLETPSLWSVRHEHFGRSVSTPVETPIPARPVVSETGEIAGPQRFLQTVR
jgi:hypothetical protein